MCRGSAVRAFDPVDLAPYGECRMDRLLPARVWSRPHRVDRTGALRIAHSVAADALGRVAGAARRSSSSWYPTTTLTERGVS